VTDRIARGDAQTIALAGGLLAAAAAVIALTGGQPDSVGLAERYAIIVALPIAAGLYAWRDGRHARFGRVLIALGFIWALPSLSTASGDLAFTLGRIGGWVAEVALIYAILSFPTGRLPGRVDRWIFGLAIADLALLFLPSLLFVDGFPQPSQWTTCETGSCPGNAFQVVTDEPAFVAEAVVPLRELLLAGLMGATVVRIVYRFTVATPLMRKTLAPVVFVALARAAALGGGITLRRIDPGAGATEVAAWVIAFGLPAIALAFLVGLLRWRMLTADALLRLAFGMRRDPHPAELRALIADALGDPSVELAHRDDASPTGWSDGEGSPMTLPLGEPGRDVTVVDQAGRPVAAIVHDAALVDQHAFVAAVGDYALTWEDNQRLADRVQASLEELRRSRARILAAADDERRRIERDLHDGGQQRLVALRMRLELAERTMGRDPLRARALIEEVADDVDTAMEELRTLAAGVYPSVLADRGLAEALRSAALRSRLPVRVTVEGTETRQPREVETATYFCCLEALQNVAKHAPDAGRVAVALAFSADRLEFAVSDDGPGFDGPADGSGLQNMRDRMAAIGGTLRIETAPGAGTTVSGGVPLRAGAAA